MHAPSQSPDRPKKDEVKRGPIPKPDGCPWNWPSEKPERIINFMPLGSEPSSPMSGYVHSLKRRKNAFKRPATLAFEKNSTGSFLPLSLAFFVRGQNQQLKMSCCSKPERMGGWTRASGSGVFRCWSGG